MIDHLVDYLNTHVALSPEERDYVRANIPVKSIAKNEFLLRQGEVSNAFYFIINGCIRMHYWVDGEDKTTFFYTENEFVSAYESFTQQLPATHSFQAVEPTQIAVISMEVAHQLLQSFPKFEFLARVAMEKELIVYQEIIACFVTMTPEQRYKKLMEDKAQLVQRIPQYHIATYLGVTAETLSRIRKRMAQK